MEQKEKLQLVIEQLEERIAPGVKGDGCNAGRGNASETDPSNDCDPGKSFKNRGGD